MKNTISYKEYIGSVEYSNEDKCLYGKILGINSLISYEAASVSELENAFKEAVDDYIETCKELGVRPERTYKGSFNVRISPELHRDASYYAAAHRTSLNSFIEQAIEKALRQG